MTEYMRNKKLTFVNEAMDYLDCDSIHVEQNSYVIADICKELNISIPDDIESFSYRRFGVESERPVRLRVIGEQDQYFPLTDTMLDWAFFHYATLMPKVLLKHALDQESRAREAAVMQYVSNFTPDFMKEYRDL